MTGALARSRQSWRSAEARLYPLAMTDVDGYQRAVLLVAAVCAQLRPVTATTSDLVGCEEHAAEYVAAAGEASGASTRGLDVDDVFGAAAAQRDRELAGEEQRRARLAAIERARLAGSSWIDLHTDDVALGVPRERIHAGAGWAILTEVGADPVTGAPALLVTTALVDLTTGELTADTGDEVHTVGGIEEWEQVAAALQAMKRS